MSDQTNSTALGKRVTQLRKSRGMTQAELARALGVSQQTVFAYEIGRRRISVLVLKWLARLFRLNIDQFLGFAPELVKKGRLSPGAMRHAERLQALSKMQQRFAVRIIDVLEESRQQEDDCGSTATQQSVSQRSTDRIDVGWKSAERPGVVPISRRSDRFGNARICLDLHRHDRPSAA